MQRVLDLSDADRRYLERVADDCRLLLGPGVVVRELQIRSNDEVVLRLTYRLGEAERASEGRGDTVIGAHAALREQLVADRIGLGLRAIWS